MGATLLCRTYSCPGVLLFVNNNIVSINNLVSRVLEERMDHSPLRSRSLLVTLFGDYVSVFSQSVHLTTIVGLLGSFGLKESLIRTTINRLLKSGWISYVKSGRNSLYSITDEGRHRFELFSKRIYRPRATEFESDWTILLIDDLSSVLLQKLRRQLLWLGFSPASPRSFVHPGTNANEARELINDLGLQEKVIVGSLLLNDDLSRELILRQTRKKLPLGAVSNSYRSFIKIYEDIWRAGPELDELDPAHSFRLRLLLIHDYRRILLRDPDLPRQYLPPNWNGVEAQKLLTDIYTRISHSSTRYFARAIQYDDKNLSLALDQTVSRFGQRNS